MSNSKRLNIFLFCEKCKDRNYSTSKSSIKKIGSKENEKLLLKKFCKRCKVSNFHKELAKK